MMHKCASFPGLVDLALGDDYDFGKEWLETNKVFTTHRNDNILNDNLQKLVDSTPKTAQIESILQQMLGRKDRAGRPVKGLFFCKHNESAYLFTQVS